MFNAVDVDSIPLIPFPQSLEKGEGFFKMDAAVNFFYPEELSNEACNLMISLIDTCTNSSEPIIKEQGTKTCNLILSDDFKSTSDSPEAYELEITSTKVTLTAKTKLGIRRGIRTLLQFRSETIGVSEDDFAYYLPAVKITDYPTFEHRGLLLDVCRHYFEMEVILKYLDAMEYYKMNVLHLHLTEDQGWRMPIEKYPLLNKISAWRLDTNGNKYGGFYTKDELKYIVEYATARDITVIPEIELPGHSQAALAAYPQFSCNGGPIEVVNDWGVFIEIYCAGNDSTFIFLEDVLTEVMEIFPSEYIHIGGDEAPKFRWEHCSKCQKRMHDEGLADEHELQSYFIQRIERFLNKNGRKLIGWDEILEGGLSPTAAVQSWRGMEGGKQAAETKHEVVMSPTSHCYLDYGLASIDLEKICSFDPIPTDLDAEYHHFIIGGECNMWTEHVPDEANLDSKVFPRMIGLAEVLWSYPKNRDFDDFYRRLKRHYPVLEEMGIDYGLETIGASIGQEFSDSVVLITLEKNLADLEVKYRWKSESNKAWLGYIEPFKLEVTDALEVQAYKNEEAYGEPIVQSFVFHQGLNKEVSYTNEWNEWYTGNAEKNLVDGKLGSIDFRDGNWQGFWGKNIDVTIDLGELKPIMSVGANFYQYANSWIFFPKEISVQISEDRELWNQLSKMVNEENDLSNKKHIKYMYSNTHYGRKDIPKARYIRFQATNVGKVPDGHEAAGQEAWLFIDEIVIE